MNDKEINGRSVRVNIARNKVNNGGFNRRQNDNRQYAEEGRY